MCPKRLQRCESRAYDVSASYQTAVIHSLFNEQGETDYLAIMENTSV